MSEIERGAANGGVTVRPLRPEDAADLYEIIRDPRVARTLLQLPSMEFLQTKEWAEETKSGQHRLVAEMGGRAVGMIGVTHYQRARLNHSGRLGMYVHPDNWGRGIGSSLMATALEIADNWLDLKRVELSVFTHNETAIHLYEKFGFQKEGRRRCFAFGDGRWLDDFLMARLRAVDYLEASEAPDLPRAGEGRGTKLENVRVRPQHPDDAPDLHEMLRHPAVGRMTLQMPSQERSAVEERVNNPQTNIHRHVAEVDGKVIGSIGLYRPEIARRAHSASIGMGVHPDYWGRGVGSALMETVLDLADNWLNLKRVELDVYTDNPAGVGLYEKFGFEVEGTRRFQAYGDGRWADSYFMARVRE